MIYAPVLPLGQAQSWTRRTWHLARLSPLSFPDPPTHLSVSFGGASLGNYFTQIIVSGAASNLIHFKPFSLPGANRSPFTVPPVHPASSPPNLLVILD